MTRILAVDDSRTIRSMLQQTLTGAGFEVELARDFSTAVESLPRHAAEERAECFDAFRLRAANGDRGQEQAEGKQNAHRVGDSSEIGCPEHNEASDREGHRTRCPSRYRHVVSGERSESIGP